MILSPYGKFLSPKKLKKYYWFWQESILKPLFSTTNILISPTNVSIPSPLLLVDYFKFFVLHRSPSSPKLPSFSNFTYFYFQTRISQLVLPRVLLARSQSTGVFVTIPNWKVWFCFLRWIFDTSKMPSVSIFFDVPSFIRAKQRTRFLASTSQFLGWYLWRNNWLLNHWSYSNQWKPDGPQMPKIAISLDIPRFPNSFFLSFSIYFCSRVSVWGIFFNRKPST